jgi:methionine-rich copper-binding protein CopC
LGVGTTKDKYKKNWASSILIISMEEKLKSGTHPTTYFHILIISMEEKLKSGTHPKTFS